MSHLSPERLAALIDEQPTAAEISHFATCAACTRERGAYEALAAMSKSGLSIGQPLTSWNRLAPALRRDGVIDDGRGFGRSARVTRGWLQAAAAVLLLVGGLAIGRMTAATGVTGPENVVSTSDSIPSFRSVAEAEAAARRSQATYQAAVAHLAANDTASLGVSTPSAIMTQVAALDRVRLALGAALEDAPYDPVINAMYLNAESQREASVRQLNSASMRFISY
jgi:hypothetical protein